MARREQHEHHPGQDYNVLRRFKWSGRIYHPGETFRPKHAATPRHRLRQMVERRMIEPKPQRVTPAIPHAVQDTPAQPEEPVAEEPQQPAQPTQEELEAELFGASLDQYTVARLREIADAWGADKPLRKSEQITAIRIVMAQHGYGGSE